MVNLKDKLIAAGIVSPQEANVSGLSLAELTVKRNAAVRAAISAQGKAYNRTPNGTFRSVAEEQAELAAINTAIRRLRKS